LKIRKEKKGVNPRKFINTVDVIVDKDYKSGDLRIAQKKLSDEGPISKLGGFKGAIVCKFLKWVITFILGAVTN